MFKYQEEAATVQKHILHSREKTAYTQLTAAHIFASDKHIQTHRHTHTQLGDRVTPQI